MDVYNLLKETTSLAKSKDFDGAISLLNEIYLSYDVLDSDVIKIIPYFQKAGRYSELEKYCLEVLIPLVIKINRKIFSDNCKQTQVAFICLSVSKIFNKLVLCAKREKNEDDQFKFYYKEKEYYKKYEEYLSAGDQLQTEFFDLVMNDTFGLEPEKWPETFKNKYSCFIESS